MQSTVGIGVIARVGRAAGWLALAFTATGIAGAQAEVTEAVPGEMFEAAPTAFDPRDPAYAMATVNGSPVTQAQVENAVRQMLAEQRQAIPPSQMAAVREALAARALDTLIGRELLAQEAARQGLEVTRAEVSEALDRVRAQLSEGQSMEAALEAQGMTQADLEANLIREMRINRMVERITADVPAPDASAVERFYAENPDEFDVPETVSVRHILVGVLPTDTDRVRQVRRRKAESLRRQVASGEGFAELAEMHSDDASRVNGGELGFVARTQVLPAFAEAVFALEPGVVGPVVESPAGFHVVEVLERRPARRLPLAESREAIRDFLHQQARQARLNERMEALREDADIRVVEP